MLIGIGKAVAMVPPGHREVKEAGKEVESRPDKLEVKTREQIFLGKLQEPGSQSM